MKCLRKHSGTNAKRQIALFLRAALGYSHFLPLRSLLLVLCNVFVFDIVQCEAVVEVLVQLVFLLLVQTDVTKRNTAVCVIKHSLQIRQNLRRLLIVHEQVVVKRFSHAVRAEFIRQIQILAGVAEDSAERVAANAFVLSLLAEEQLRFFRVVRDGCDQLTVALHCEVVQNDRAVFAGFLFLEVIPAVRCNIADLGFAKVNATETDAAANEKHQCIAELTFVIEILCNLEDVLFVADGIDRAA